jgi:hypothetical protein
MRSTVARKAGAGGGFDKRVSPGVIGLSVRSTIRSTSQESRRIRRVTDYPRVVAKRRVIDMAPAAGYPPPRRQDEAAGATDARRDELRGSLIDSFASFR